MVDLSTVDGAEAARKALALVVATRGAERETSSGHNPAPQGSRRRQPHGNRRWTRAIVEMAKRIAQERISKPIMPQVPVQRTVEQFVDVPMPQAEEIVEVLQIVPERIVEPSADLPVPLMLKEIVEIVDVSVPPVVEKIVEVVQFKEGITEHQTQNFWWMS